MGWVDDGHRLRRFAVAALLAAVPLLLWRDPDCLGRSGADPAVAAGHVDLLTFNVAGLPTTLSASEPHRFMPRIAPLLGRYDLVLLQEDFAYHDLLMQGARFPCVVPPTPPDDLPFGDGLCQLSRFRLHDPMHVRWAACSGVVGGYFDCLAAKGFSVATVELAAGVAVDVYDLHADAGDESGDRWARAEGFAGLCTFAAHHSAGRAMIVAGDFNMRWSCRADRAVLERLERELDLCDAAAWLGATSDLERIDKVMVRNGGGVELTPVAIAPAAELDGLSDHRALWVRLQWRRGRARVAASLWHAGEPWRRERTLP